MVNPLQDNQHAKVPGRVELGRQADALVAMVDDEPLVVELTRAFLEEAGFKRFVSTSDPAHAIDLLLKEKADVLLLDINMPKVSGFDVLARMRKDDDLKHLPVIILTSADDPETKLKALDLGASDFLRKPVDPSELALRIRNTLAATAYRDSIRNAFARYVSPRIVDRIINDSVAFGSKPQRADVVALFADLRGFTRMTEMIPVEPLVEMLNEYFKILTAAAYQHDGTILNMAGDSLLVCFNVPFAQPDATVRAWHTAMEMLVRFGSIARGWRERHGVESGVGIGMCRGEAVIGNVGSPSYMSYTVIGNTINIAARLMQMAGPGEALIAGQLFKEIREIVPAGRFEGRGNVEIRGATETIPVFSIKL
jgi:class 3 adenylate cyclase